MQPAALKENSNFMFNKHNDEFCCFNFILKPFRINNSKKLKFFKTKEFLVFIYTFKNTFSGNFSQIRNVAE